ncbi:MAG TPA: hypothetical protein VK034_19455, partial [Enhygromyxa sp.]|nr:hypothetical protein [Enhygromyxa sp.]
MTMHPSEDQARELMSAWARDQAPAAEVCERTWAAVRARASAGELGPELEPEPGSLTATVVSTGARLRLLLVGLGVAAVVGGIALQRARNDPTEAPADPAPVVEPEHEVAPPSIE